MSKIRNFIFIFIFFLSFFFNLPKVEAFNVPCTTYGKYPGPTIPGNPSCHRTTCPDNYTCEWSATYKCGYCKAPVHPPRPSETPVPTLTTVPPQTCGPLYYCYTANNSYTCRPTSPIYNPVTHIQCGASATCEQNIAAVFPGQTTGICYPSTANCLAGCVRPPTPTLTPTPTVPPVPRCQQMSVFLAGVDITGNLSRIKFGDTVTFKAYAPVYAGQIVRSITFEIFKNGVSSSIVNAPAGVENNRWVATYSYVVNSYGSFLVKVKSINL